MGLQSLLLLRTGLNDPCKQGPVLKLSLGDRAGTAWVDGSVKVDATNTRLFSKCANLARAGGWR